MAEDRSTVLIDVTVDNGKYRFVYHMDDKPPEAYRHGERWAAREDIMVGDKALMALCARVAELEGTL